MKKLNYLLGLSILIGVFMFSCQSEDVSPLTTDEKNEIIVDGVDYANFVGDWIPIECKVNGKIYTDMCELKKEKNLFPITIFDVKYDKNVDAMLCYYDKIGNCIEFDKTIDLELKYFPNKNELQLSKINSNINYDPWKITILNDSTFTYVPDLVSSKPIFTYRRF